MKHLDELFDNMDAWRHLPSYQLERRADIFFSIYLSDLLYDKFDVIIDGVLPEFPVRIGTIRAPSNSNQSYRIDYLVKVKDANRVILVELKTDNGSRRTNQDWYLERAQQVGLTRLLEGVREIYKATSSKKKYRYLLSKMQDMGFITLERDGEFGVARADYDIQIVYIQPTNREGQENAISFQEAARIVERHEDELSIRFAQSLVEWSVVRAGERREGTYDR
jgi:hypothetical protein